MFENHRFQDSIAYIKYNQNKYLMLDRVKSILVFVEKVAVVLLFVTMGIMILPESLIASIVMFIFAIAFVMAMLDKSNRPFIQARDGIRFPAGGLVLDSVMIAGIVYGYFKEQPEISPLFIIMLAILMIDFILCIINCTQRKAEATRADANQ